MTFGKRKITLELKSSKDYVDLYKRMGCIPQMVDFYHLFDDVGHTCRVYWPNTVYHVEHYGQKMYCTQHEECGEHKYHKMVDKSSKNLRGICPKTLEAKKTMRYYDDIKFKGIAARFQHPDEKAIKYTIQKARSMFFYTHLYDTNVLINSCKDHHEDHYTGMIPVIDVDVTGSQDSRDDMLNKAVFKEFEIMNRYVSDQLEKEDLSFHKHTSGNGLYFILDAIPMEQKEIEPFKIAFKDFCLNMADYLSKLKLIHIDALAVPGWNRYYKIPFTLHQSFDRIALPLNPSGDLDYEYVKHYSNPLNLNANICKKIWSESKYDK